MVSLKTDKCPHCGASWDGGSIVDTVKKQRDGGDRYLAGWSDADIDEYVKKSYSPPYRWSRLIGIEDLKLYDGISYWQCPDCNTVWDR